MIVTTSPTSAPPPNAAAKRRLPKGVFEFVDRATEDHIALASNRSAFEAVKLRHRALVDVSGRSTTTMLFGKPMSVPMAIAPTGAAGLCWYRGELALAKAAAAAGIPLTLSTASMTAMETIADQAGGRLWFQLYVRYPSRFRHRQSHGIGRQSGSDRTGNVVWDGGWRAGRRGKSDRFYQDRDG